MTEFNSNGCEFSFSPHAKIDILDACPIIWPVNFSSLGIGNRFHVLPKSNPKFCTCFGKFGTGIHEKSGKIFWIADSYSGVLHDTPQRGLMFFEGKFDAIYIRVGAYNIRND